MTPRRQVIEDLLSAFAVAVINMTDNPCRANNARLRAAVKELAVLLANEE
jgi:hypothetical protein